MQIESKIIILKNTGDISTEYIESQLEAQNIIPLRWAIVEVNPQTITVSVTSQV